MTTETDSSNIHEAERQSADRANKQFNYRLKCSYTLNASSQNFMYITFFIDTPYTELID